MKTQIKTHSNLHSEIEDILPKIRLSSQEQNEFANTKDSSILIILVTGPSSTTKGFYADTKKSQKVTYLSVRSNNRERSKLIVKKCLSELNVKFKDDNSPSLGTKGGFAINLNDKVVKIVFKFKNGFEQQDFKGWNEELNKIFTKKPHLKRVPSDRNERLQIQSINEQIKEPIQLQIQSEIYNNVIGFVAGSKIGGEQKADLVVIDTKGNEVCFISYKSGKTATSFQQYSGLTSRSKLDQHREVKDFYQQVEENKKTLEEEKTAVWRPIKDRDLKRKAVFGYDYGKKNNGNNVNFIIQGDLKLTERGSRYVLQTSAGLIAKNGDLSKLTQDYEPTLGARPAEASRKYAKITGVRGGIFPKKYLKNRNKNKKV